MPTSDQVVFYLQALTRWRHRAHNRLNEPDTHFSTSEGWKAEANCATQATVVQLQLTGRISEKASLSSQLISNNNINDNNS